LKRQNKRLAIIIGLLLAGFTEPFLFNFSFKNLILLFMGEKLFEMVSDRGTKEIQLLNVTEKKMIIPLLKPKEGVGTRLLQYKKQLICIAMLTGALTGIFVSFGYSKPEKIWVADYKCDYISEEPVQLEDITGENIVIYKFLWV